MSDGSSSNPGAATHDSKIANAGHAALASATKWLMCQQLKADHDRADIGKEL